MEVSAVEHLASLESVSLLLQAQPSKSTFQTLCSSVVSRIMEEPHLPTTVAGTCLSTELKYKENPGLSVKHRAVQQVVCVTLSTAKRCLGRRHMVRHTGTSSEEQKGKKGEIPAEGHF